MMGHHGLSGPRREQSVANLAIEGRLPEEVAGTLYRNGPVPQFADPQAHWFAGDGMVHAVTLAQGSAGYRNRWVRTARFEAERAAGRQLGAALAGDDGVANTHVLMHAGRLMALEEAHGPIELDPVTLHTRGAAPCGGPAPFTAHPKRDPLTGALVFMGYAVDGPGSCTMRCGALDRTGAMVWETRFAAPYSAMVHDFAVTARHVVVPVLPLAIDPRAAGSGLGGYGWMPELGGWLAVLQRGAEGAAVRWFAAPAGFAFHVVNAFEQDGGRRIVIDLLRYSEPPLFPRADGTIGVPTPAVPCRWTLELGTQVVRETVLSGLAGEFPRIDERLAGQEYRSVYLACHGSGPARDCIARLDVDTAKVDRCSFNAGSAVSEPVFVPRDAGAALDDGWLLAVVTAPEADCASTLVVLDAGAVAQGPIARVMLPVRVPPGFHGSFVPAAMVGDGR